MNIYWIYRFIYCIFFWSITLRKSWVFQNENHICISKCCWPVVSAWFTRWRFHYNINIYLHNTPAHKEIDERIHDIQRDEGKNKNGSSNSSNSLYNKRSFRLSVLRVHRQPTHTPIISRCSDCKSAIFWKILAGILCDTDLKIL